MGLTAQYPRDCLDGLIKICQGRVAQSPEYAEHNQAVQDQFSPVPDRHILEMLLEVAYAASLRSEEGRYPAFALAYISPAGCLNSEVDVTHLGSKRDLNSREVAKIAPAVDPNTTFLAAWAEPGQPPQLWGLLRSTELPWFGAPIDGNPTYITQSFLMVRVRGPGVLFVYHGSYLALHLVRGEARWRPPAGRLQQLLREMAHIKGNDAEAVSQIATRMALLQRGGALLITDPALAVKPELLDLSYRFETPSLALRNAVDAEKASKADAKLRPKAMPALRATLDWVARLTLVDGAVHMTSDLAIMGFGGKVATQKPRLRQLVDEDPETADTRPLALESIPGMRHRSAALFCSEQEGQALGVVVSQDGDVTVFARQPDGAVRRIGNLPPVGLAVG